MGIETRFPPGTVIRAQLDPSVIAGLNFQGLYNDIYDLQGRPYVYTGTGYVLNGTAAVLPNNGDLVVSNSTTIAPTQAAVVAALAPYAKSSDLTALLTAVNAAVATGVSGAVTQAQLTAAVGGFNTTVSNKADKSYVDGLGAGYATTTQVNLRALQTDLVSGLGFKADYDSTTAALLTKSDKGHTHDIATLVNAVSWATGLIDARLLQYKLITGAPAPSPSPTPAPAPGSGTGATETVVPSFNAANGPMGITDNGDGTYSVVVGNGWSTGSAAIDYYTLQPRINGAPVTGISSKFYVDNTAAAIAAACLYGAYDSDVGGLLSWAVTGTNEAGSFTEYTDGLKVSRSANSGSAGGGTTAPVTGTGQLSLLSINLTPSNFTIPTGARSFAVFPTNTAGVIKKAGGETLNVSDLGAGMVTDSSAGTTVSTTYAGGTPTASGTTTTAEATYYNTLAAGLHVEALADTTLRTMYVNMSVFSGTFTIACTNPDGSSSPLSIAIPSETTGTTGAPSTVDVGVNRIVAVQFKAGSASQLSKFDMTMTEIKVGTNGGGNAHIGSIYVV